MAIYREEETNGNALLEIAKQMVIAARTAPKTRGRDVIYTAILTDDDIVSLSGKMREIGERTNRAFFVRDANCVLQAKAVVLIGAMVKATDLDRCGYCGLDNCAAKNQQPRVPCAFNNIDLGIALGSAVALAADHRVDNRIMFSIGKAALELKFLTEEAAIIMGIPLSATSKNPFFDRG
jgi:uncharacterized ferredoxin-like protein